MTFRYLFIIDLPEYAGNHERDLCAYVTGHIGDCYVGREMAELYRAEVKEDLFEGNILNVPDDHGCSRPCTIWPSPDGDTNSVAIYFDSPPTEAQVALMKERALNYGNLPRETYGVAGMMGPRIARPILGFRLLEEVTTYNEIDL